MPKRHRVAAAMVVALSAPASAQGHDADTLYREGTRLLRQGKLAEACERLEASERLDATFSHEFVLGECHERNGRLATASEWFVKAAERAHATRGYGARERDARRRVARLAPRLAHLRIVVDDLVENLVITRNDAVVDRAAWNQRVAVDAGTYKIAAAAPGHRGWSTEVEIAGETETVEIPELELDEVTVPLQTPPAQRSPSTLEEPAPEQQTRTSGKRKLAILVGGVGLIEGVIGAAYEIRASERPSDPEAGMSRTIARIAIGTGAASIVSAVVLWAVGGAPPMPSVSVAIGPGGATFAIGGRF